jgi:hypothetical protein
LSIQSYEYGASLTWATHGHTASAGAPTHTPRRWLINPETGEVVFWTSDTGFDGHTPVELDDLDLIGIHPLPSYVWYQDMADFADLISHEL